MTSSALRCLAALLIAAVPWDAHSGRTIAPSQSSNPASLLVGSWQSGSFAFTFQPDGSYVYVGGMGSGGIQTRIAEEGTYRIDGRTLITNRKRGLITNTQNYRQVLEPETTRYQV